MSRREPVSPKLRFQVLKRDNFTCQYCGKTHLDSILEVDHILPVSKGGTSSIENLKTACHDCNRGKGAELVSKVSFKSVVESEVQFGKRLRSVRLSSGATQSDMARFLGITLRSWQRYEAGEREPNMFQIAQIVRYFDVTADYLLGLSNSNPSQKAQ